MADQVWPSRFDSGVMVCLGGVKKKNLFGFFIEHRHSFLFQSSGGLGRVRPPTLLTGPLRDGEQDAQKDRDGTWR